MVLTAAPDMNSDRESDVTNGKFLATLLLWLGVPLLAGAVGYLIMPQEEFFWPDSIPDPVAFVAVAVVPISILVPLDFPLFFVGQMVGIEALLALALWIGRRRKWTPFFVTVTLVVAYVATVLGTNLALVLIR